MTKRRKTEKIETLESRAAFLVTIDEVFRTIRTTVRVAGWLAGAYILRDSLGALAGHSTQLALQLSRLGDLKFSLSIALAGSTFAWAVVERKLRHRKVEYLQGRVRELEIAIDPNRTSSKLTASGKTNPRDIG